MGRSLETKMRRQEAREARKEKRMKHAAEKFAEEREEIQKVEPLVGLNPKQKAMLRALREKTLIVVDGLAGTGKTYLAAAFAADLFRENQIDKIVVTRPLVYCGGKTSGYKPGGVVEKMGPYVRPMLEVIMSRLGKGAYKTALANGTDGRIEILEFESVRGRSIGSSKCPTILIVDEAQNATPEELFSMITRIGEGSKVILLGDVYQRDTRNSGLKWLTTFIENHEGLDEFAEVIHFNRPEDIVRSGLTKAMITAVMEDADDGLYVPISK